MKQSNLYMYHLDNLRRGRKITVASFCDGICSDRHYRRLLSGEQNITNNKINDFCNKLGISTKDFYYSANEKDNYEYSKIMKLYLHLCKNDLDEFRNELKNIKRERLISNQNKRFLEYCLVRYQYMLKKLSDRHCLEQLSLICNYPINKTYASFDFVDIISLVIIAEIEVKAEKLEALNLLRKILTSKSLVYISSESRHILPSIYGTVSILLSRLEKYEKASSVANSGIKYSIRHSNFSTLTHLYYVMCYTSFKMNKIARAEQYAAKSIANAISRGNKLEYKMTYRLIEKNLKVDPLSLFNYYREHLVE